MMAQFPKACDIDGSAYEDDGYRGAGDGEQPIHQECEVNPARHRHGGDDDSRIEAHADRAARNLKHVDDGSGQACLRSIDRGDGSSGDRRVEEAYAYAEHNHPGDELIVGSVRRDVREQDHAGSEQQRSEGDDELGPEDLV